MRADTIIKNAKRAIGDIIITYLRKIAGFIETGDKKLMSGPEEEVIISTSDFASRWNIPVIRVEVDNSYLDVDDRIYEDWEVQEICLSDGEWHVEANGEDFGEDELTTDELQEIANALQKEYEEMTK